MNSPLLITATFDAGRTPQVALNCAEDRLIKHLEGLLAWLRDPRFSRIVLAKNCKFPIRTGILEKVAAAYGKELEILQVSDSPKTCLQGKGYGEGDLIRQALEKSEILRTSNDFFKITGKLYALKSEAIFNGEGEGEFYLSSSNPKNTSAVTRRVIAPLYGSSEGCRILAFLRRWLRIPWGLVAACPSGWIDTRFYRVRRDFYLETLLRSHERVQDALGYTLENAFFDDLQNKSVRFIAQQPIIIGTSGTLGTTAGAYSTEIQQEARVLAKRLIL